jgi:hypothetical protein
MPGTLVADEMGHGKTFTSAATAMICKLVTEKVVMELPLSIVCVNSLEECVMLGHKDFPGIVGEEQEWYLLEFCSLASVGDPDNSTSGESSTCISPRTDPGRYNALSGRNFKDCHQRNYMWNKFQSGQLVACRK